MVAMVKLLSVETCAWRLEIRRGTDLSVAKLLLPGALVRLLLNLVGREGRFLLQAESQKVPVR